MRTAVFILAFCVAHSLGASSRLQRRFEVKLNANVPLMQVTQTDPPSPSHGPTYVRVFDARYVNRERKAVRSKYMPASKVFEGIGINPMERIPFADQFPFFQDPANPTNTTTLIKEPDALLPSREGLSTVPLTDFILNRQDLMYYGQLGLGSNRQTMSFDIDTGSADLWAISNCDGCPSNEQYDISTSTTYKDLNQYFSVTYGSGEVEGKLVEDTVMIGGIPVRNQAFGAVNYESSDFDYYPVSGILGFAFSSISSSGRRTVFENLMTNGQVLAPFFSVHLERNREHGSEVCLGCYNALKTKGPVTWVPVQSKTYWSVHMNGLRHNATTMLKTDLIAAIDTGTTLIYLPEKVAREFYQGIPGSKSCPLVGPGFFSYPCDADLDIAFVFGGQEFSVNVRDFMLGRLSDKTKDCVGGIVSLGSGFPDTIAIIGDAFLKSWYSVYDYSNGARVGFAPSVNK